jgi:5-methylcytosine-specific restriction endonuclease McrA
MADTLVAKTTGLPTATTADGETGIATPGIEIQLVMSERTLIRGDHEPAHVPGFGPIPAPIARRLTRRADKVWLRRLFTHPATGELVATDSRRRLFDGRLREMVIARDRTCRNPWCDAPIRHVDHIRPHSRGGATAFENGQGLCEACNYVKEAPGWRTDVIHLPGTGQVVETTTPTNRRYRSQAPPQPGAGPPGSLSIALDRLITDSA